jgi:P-type Cu+ transporter
MVHDPVCGMEIKETIKAEATVYKGKSYYFCSTLCKIQFEQNPEKYVKKSDDKHNAHHNH